MDPISDKWEAAVAGLEQATQGLSGCPAGDLNELGAALNRRSAAIQALQRLGRLPEELAARVRRDVELGARLHNKLLLVRAKLREELGQLDSRGHLVRAIGATMERRNRVDCRL